MVTVCTCMYGSAHDCGCMVNGSSAMQRAGRYTAHDIGGFEVRAWAIPEPSLHNFRSHRNLP